MSPAPRRVISLTPSNTEIVAFLGATQRLVGVDDWSDWPTSVEALPQVGPDLQIDLDAVEDLDPDLVLASLSVPGQEEVVQGVQARGFEHLVLAPMSTQEILADIRTVAEAMGLARRGIQLAEAMAAELDRLGEVSAGLEERRVYWEWWPKPPIAVGGEGWMPEVMALAGANGCFQEHQGQSLEVTTDQVAAADPDAAVLCWQGALHERQHPGALSERGGWEQLAMVQEDQVLCMPEALFGRPGPRLLEGIRRLLQALHPGLPAEEVGKPYGWLPPDLATELSSELAEPLGQER